MHTQRKYMYVCAHVYVCIRFCMYVSVVRCSSMRVALQRRSGREWGAVGVRRRTAASGGLAQGKAALGAGEGGGGLAYAGGAGPSSNGCRGGQCPAGHSHSRELRDPFTPPVWSISFWTSQVVKCPSLRPWPSQEIKQSSWGR